LVFKRHRIGETVLGMADAIRRHDTARVLANAPPDEIQLGFARSVIISCAPHRGGASAAMEFRGGLSQGRAFASSVIDRRYTAAHAIGACLFQIKNHESKTINHKL
jgi:hypothetical protein